MRADSRPLRRCLGCELLPTWLGSDVECRPGGHDDAALQRTAGPRWRKLLPRNRLRRRIALALRPDARQRDAGRPGHRFAKVDSTAKSGGSAGLVRGVRRSLDQRDNGSVERLHEATGALQTIDSVATNPDSVLVDGSRVWVGDWFAPRTCASPRSGHLGLARSRFECGAHSCAPGSHACGGSPSGAGAIWATTPEDRALSRIDPNACAVKRVPLPYPPTGVTGRRGRRLGHGARTSMNSDTRGELTSLV